MSKIMVDVNRRLHALCVFRGLLDEPLFRTYFEFGETTGRIDAYSRFVGEIYRGGGDLSECVRRLVFENENLYIAACAKGETPNANIVASVERELETLSAFASLTPAEFTDLLGDVEVARFDTAEVDLKEEYAARVAQIGKYGYGVFASHGMFRLTDDMVIEPIRSADPITLDSFIGYREEREQVLENTRAFVEGRVAANILLYGDAGTGKSSTVKAVANKFYADGVRLIELRKDQMSMLPFVMEKIHGNPLHFIIFIDDLSFTKQDDTFSMLKAALEGSASAKAPNAVIYATSNRRHIVRESFDEREGSDIHRNDTMQELLSLSARFGLSIRFEKPNKALYLEIVHELAQKRNIQIPMQELDTRAEAFALAKGHRSARCAEQFIDTLR